MLNSLLTALAFKLLSTFATSTKSSAPSAPTLSDFLRYQVFYSIPSCAHLATLGFEIWVIFVSNYASLRQVLLSLSYSIGWVPWQDNRQHELQRRDSHARWQRARVTLGPLAQLIKCRSIWLEANLDSSIICE